MNTQMIFWQQFREDFDRSYNKRTYFLICNIQLNVYTYILEECFYYYCILIKVVVIYLIVGKQ